MADPFASSSSGPGPTADFHRLGVPLDLSLEGYAGLDDAFNHDEPAPHVAARGDTFARFETLSVEEQQRQSIAEDGVYGISAAEPMPMHRHIVSSTGDAAQDHDSADQGTSHAGTLGAGRIVADPPDLDSWRERLFSVDDTIVLTNEQFETYFPHVDNVYSHRSTQRYKRKPFVSHYWDCRMKGRPPGTPKSEDPSKKKRKRTARERDLCDVKIKITEYLPGAQIEDAGASQDAGVSSALQDALTQAQAAATAAGAPDQRFWTIQRVNGNGGNGKGDGVAGPHKHSLARSDEIKKNSVQRFLATQDKESRKLAKLPSKKPSGKAAATARKRGRENELKFLGSWFCPFSQRVWIALEATGVIYQYVETDPFRRAPGELQLATGFSGRIPAIMHGDWSCDESSVILEYLEDLDSGRSLYPADAKLRATCRIWINFINRKMIPTLHFLFRTPPEEPLPLTHASNFHGQLEALTAAADKEGPFFKGGHFTLVDIHFAPFALRFRKLLQPRVDWAITQPGTRLHAWISALEGQEHVKATLSLPERYAEVPNELVQPAYPNM